MKNTRIPTNGIMILKHINSLGPQTQKLMHSQFNISLRALRYALDKLEKEGYLIKRSNLVDMRSPYYCITPSGKEYGRIDNSLTSIVSKELAHA